MVDKSVIVTGGARGIGRAVAAHLLRIGWRVALVDVDGNALDGAVKALSAVRDVMAIRADVAVETDVVRAVAEAVERPGRIDGLVNNAGVSSREPLEEASLEAWNRVLAVNLTASFLFAREAASHLRAARGAIVNIASTRALMSEPGSEAYAASKGGLVALTHALAVSLGPEIRVNCISPGWIDTAGPAGGGDPSSISDADHRQHPAGRVGRPDDVAQATAFLLGGESGFVTGANLVVDGGMTRKMIYL